MNESHTQPRSKTAREVIADLEKFRERMDATFEHDEKLGHITIKVPYGHDYDIELSRIPDPEALLHWVEHLTGKDWMPSELVREFIRRVCSIKGWNLHRRNL